VIEIDHVTKRYGDTVVVDRLTLSVRTGEFCALVGTSGAGKSTMLRMINRLVPVSAGSIRVDGVDVAQIRPEALRRRMGYVIQSIGLFPHWTVARNVAAVPELLAWPRAKIRARVDELLTMLQLDPRRFAEQFPHQLSLGQQQRVGIARALAADPDILLMDEPFAALDPITRAALQGDIARIHRERRNTIIFVTHDMDEALRLASRIAIMDRGRLVQVGAPLDLLAKPANDFVRDFVGRDDLGLKLLAAETVAARLRPGESAPGEPIAAAASLRQALSQMIARGTDRLAVSDGVQSLGAIHLADLLRR
jgi:osmoprotectant transport system ATP-binding protein